MTFLQFITPHRAPDGSWVVGKNNAVWMVFAFLGSIVFMVGTLIDPNVWPIGVLGLLIQIFGWRGLIRNYHNKSA